MGWHGNSPSESGRDGTSLNVGNDIVGEKPGHARLGPHDVPEVTRLNTLGEVFKLHNSSLDVVQDMSSSTKRAMVNSNYGNPIVAAFRRRDMSPTQESGTCRKLHCDKSINTLYILVNELTGIVDGNISLEPLPSLSPVMN